jgi:hypothetical protein
MDVTQSISDETTDPNIRDGIAAPAIGLQLLDTAIPAPTELLLRQESVVRPVAVGLFLYSKGALRLIRIHYNLLKSLATPGCPGAMRREW